MKVTECFFLGLIALSPSLVAQQEQAFDHVTSHAFIQQLDHDGVYDFISTKIAESLVISRVEPVFSHHDMDARVSGTVIVAFELSKDGKILHLSAVSGPAFFRPAVLAAVRQWKFKPYLVDGKPVAVATSIPLAVSNW